MKPEDFETRHEHVGPVVFPFQPKFFVDVETAEQYREWERLLAEECGITILAQEPYKDGGKDWSQGETISGSGGVGGGFDDSDYQR